MSKRSWYVDGRRFHSVDELKQAEDKSSARRSGWRRRATLAAIA